MMTSFATLTIGQAPRSDIMPLLDEYLPPDMVTHTGLLDGLTLAQIEQRFSPGPGEDVLVSRLLDGTQVRLASPRVEQALQQKNTILLLCTGVFHNLRAKEAMLLEPDRIIPPLINGIVGTHQVGIVVPVVEQIEHQAGKWSKLSKKPCYATASPYVADEQTLIEAALSLKEQGAQVVLLDCIGYQRSHCDIIQKQLDVPVVLSNSLVVKLAAELLY
jgi:protein AroM